MAKVEQYRLTEETLEFSNLGYDEIISHVGFQVPDHIPIKLQTANIKYSDVSNISDDQLTDLAINENGVVEYNDLDWTYLKIKGTKNIPVGSFVDVAFKTKEA